MQNLKKTLYKALCGAALILFAAGCADVLQAPGAPEAKTGKVTLTIDSGPARTVAPGMGQFKKISLSFVGLDGTADLDDIDASDGSAEVALPLGSWTVTARAYHNAGDAEPAAQAANTLEYDGATVKGETLFTLQPTGTGPGTLKYTVTVPNSVALANNGDSRIRIEVDGAAFADLDNDGFTDGERAISGSEAKTVSLTKGVYMADILLEANDGNTAVYRESVVLESGLITEIVFSPTAGDFVDPEVRAAMTDLADQALTFGAIADDASTTDVDEPVLNGSWTLDITAAAKAAKVYFTLVKTADYSVAIKAEDSNVAKTVDAAGGASAGDSLAIVEVDTADIATAAGGTKTFTMIITKEGKLGTPVGVTVTLPVTYTATADGDSRTVSTKIDFVFGAALDLSEGEISVDPPASLALGNLTGAGTNYSLAITAVNTPGTVKLAINKDGVEATEKPVTLYKPVTYTAVADGNDMTDSTKIEFTFSAVVGLVLTDVSVVDGTGSVTTGGLIGNGTSWSLEISSVSAAGTVTVTINKDGIEAVEKEVTVNKGPVLTEEVQFGQTSGSDDVIIGELVGGPEDAEQSQPISAVEKNVVYFTVAKKAAQTITASGADANKVTVHTSGTVDGETATDTWAALAVDARGLVFDGGTRTFTLTVTEEGALPRAIAVTLDITTNKTGAAAFKVTRPAGQTYAGSDDLATLERLDTGAAALTSFQTAVEYVDVNAQANTEYLIRVEQDNLSLPRFILTFNDVDNVTLRLRGDKNGPWTLKHGNTGTTSWNADLAVWGGSPLSNLITGYGFINIGLAVATSANKRTFILGSNVTIAGLGDQPYASNTDVRTAFYVYPNATLIMEKGSAVIDFVSESSAIIWVASSSTAGKDPTKHGKLRIEGGSITNCKPGDDHLIHFNGGGELNLQAGSFYKAASTGDNPITFSGNSSATLFFYRTSKTSTSYDLLATDGEMSLPAAN